MSWIRGTATDYKDFSDEIVAAVTGQSLQSVDSISAGGSGYVVGEIITFTGGTFTQATQLEVLTVSAGAVTSVRVYNAGAYSSAPSDSNATTSDGSGTGATFTHTYASNGWTAMRDQGTGISAVDSIVSGGSGYSVDDIITLAGGVYSTVAQLRVTSVSSGVITGVSIEAAGYYRVIPSDPVAQTSVSPSGGTGATFNLTWDSGEREVILEGEGDGTDQIYVGWRTLSGAGYYNFELHGMIGYNAAVKMEDQPNCSPGFWDQATTTLQAGAYMMCHNTTLSWWISVDSYRIIIVAKVGTAYFNAYLGFGNRFATSSEYPYPLFICGHNSYAFDLSNQSKLSSGLVDPWASSTNYAYGPAFVMGLDNAWVSIRNAVISTTYTNSRTGVVAPAQFPEGMTSNSTPPEDRFTDTEIDWDDLIRQSTTGVPAYNIDPVDGTTPAQTLIPTMVMYSVPSTGVSQIFLELDGVYWMTSYTPSGLIQSEDRIIDGSDTYRVFQNCNRTDSFAFLAIKEA